MNINNIIGHTTFPSRINIDICVLFYSRNFIKSATPKLPTKSTDQVFAVTTPCSARWHKRSAHGSTKQSINITIGNFFMQRMSWKEGNSYFARSIVQCIYAYAIAIPRWRCELVLSFFCCCLQLARLCETKRKIKVSRIITFFIHNNLYTRHRRVVIYFFYKSQYAYVCGAIASVSVLNAILYFNLQFYNTFSCIVNIFVHRFILLANTINGKLRIYRYTYIFVIKYYSEHRHRQ